MSGLSCVLCARRVFACWTLCEFTCPSFVRSCHARSGGVILSGAQPGRYEGVTSCNFTAASCTCVVPPVTTTLEWRGVTRTLTTEFGPEYSSHLVEVPEGVAVVPVSTGLGAWGAALQLTLRVVLILLCLCCCLHGNTANT